MYVELAAPVSQSSDARPTNSHTGNAIAEWAATGIGDYDGTIPAESLTQPLGAAAGIYRQEQYHFIAHIGLINPGINADMAKVGHSQEKWSLDQYIAGFFKDRLHKSGVLSQIAGGLYGVAAWLVVIQMPHPAF